VKINQLIREKRLSKNLTQQQLGELLNYTGASAQVMVALIESGSPIPRRKILLLAKLLSIPVSQLI
jgi:transcriptional regulator with XRE-family HTH domain